MKIKVEQKVTLRHDLTATISAYIEEDKKTQVYVTMTGREIDDITNSSPELELVKQHVIKVANQISSLL